MISSIIDVILLVALAGTSGAVILMYRRLQRFDALQNAAAKEFARSSEALDRAREAMSKLSDDGGQMAITLAGRLNEARVLMNDIEETTTRTRGTLIEMQDYEDELAQRPQPAPATAPAPAAQASTADQPAQAQAAPAPQPKAAANMAASPVAEHAAVEIVEEEVAAPARKAVPAAIRIRDAARARIAAAREKGAEQHPGLARAPRPALAASDPVPAERPVLTSPTGLTVAPVAMGPFLPSPASAETRPASAASTLARERATPNGPLMMLVKSGEAAATARQAEAEEADAAELEKAMGTLTGRQVTWSELASAARTA